MARRWWAAAALVVGGIGAIGCGGSAPASTASAGDRAVAIDRERAIEIARDAADAEGYARADYEVRGAELVMGSVVWRVDLVHVAPTPPGAHCTVDVDAATGSTDLVHGR